MDKKKELAKNTIIIAVGKICTQFVNFLLLPLYTALLLPEEYGIVELLNTYVALLVPIFNWQFETGLFRFMLDYRKNYKKTKELLSTVLCINIIQCFIYLLFFVFAQNFIKFDYKFFLAFDVVLNIILNTMLQFPRGLGNSKIYSMGSFVSACSTVVLNVVFIVIFRMQAIGMFLAMIIGKIITIIYLFISTKAWNYFSFKCYNKKLFKSVSKYSLPLVPNQLSWWVIGVSDRTIVSSFISVAANGIYSVANKFSSIYITIYNIFNLSWNESVSVHLNEPDYKKFLEDTINSMYLLFSSLCFGIIAFMPFGFPFLVGKGYSEAYEQIPILMIAVLFQSLVGLYSAFYVALKKSKEIAKTSFFAAVINISINVLLIKHFGLYAASVSTLIAYSTMAIFRYFHVKKYIDIPLEKKNIFLSVLVGTIAVLLYYQNHLITNLISLVIVCLYAVLLNYSFLKATFIIIKNKMSKIRINVFSK